MQLATGKNSSQIVMTKFEPGMLESPCNLQRFEGIYFGKDLVRYEGWTGVSHP